MTLDYAVDLLMVLFCVDKWLLTVSYSVDKWLLTVLYHDCSKVQKYSPADSAKVWDKQVNRKVQQVFSPKSVIDMLQQVDRHTAGHTDQAFLRYILADYLQVRFRS